VVARAPAVTLADGPPAIFTALDHSPSGWLTQ